jgi:hypothetical protein
MKITFIITMLLFQIQIIKVKSIRVGKTLQNDISHNEISYKVDKLRLRDLNNSLLGDLYPVYFQVEIEFNNESISIIFVRNYGLKEEFSRSYQSILVKINNTENNSLSKAKCSLFLRVDSYKMAKKYGLKWSRNWFLSQPLEDLFYIDLTLHRFDDVVIRVVLDLSGEYVSNLKRYLAQPTKKDKRKRRSLFKRTHLIVDSCVFIHYPIFNEAKYFLKTNDIDYVRLYLSVRFSEILLNINKIYETIPSDWYFKISVVFSHLFIETELDSRLWTPYLDSSYSDTAAFINHINP